MTRSTSMWLRSRAHELPEIKEKCRNVISRFSKSRRQSPDFTYDALSYALNFDEGSDDSQFDEFPFRNFSARLPASPPRLSAANDVAPPVVDVFSFGIVIWRRRNSGGGRYLLQQQEENWWVKRGKKVKEMSEVLAGPKWKTFIRKFSGYSNNKKRKVQFQYDPQSYALNFDGGVDWEVDDGAHLWSEQSRVGS
ncbi:hypothetical protein HHK36_025865 [Tetracentron sinense]|uniref:Uncharacterized protein n=1 Tax=Tetracentron sinense TaxID=13715 RepID=A0A834YIJ3_TETSI|nr:hypothetical protein HHK36_025865 [Tetracentron sinense]